MPARGALREPKGEGYDTDMRTLPLLLASLLASLPAARVHAAYAPEQVREILASPQYKLKTYAFDPKSTLDSRLGPCPKALLELLKEQDERKDYEGYAPTPAEAALLRGYLATLPPKMTQAFEERLLGVWFVKNFTGNGMSSWVLGKDGALYAWIVLNPSGFSRSISQTLTARDASLFKDSPGLSIDAGDKYSGIFYTILHEGTHAYDYIRGITPYVEEFPALARGKALDASWDVWRKIDAPRTDAVLPLRDKLHFYGLAGGPALAAAEARPLYTALAKSPFASLYGSQSWAEDVADLVTFHHLAVVLKQPYQIMLPPSGREKGLTVEPMKTGRAKERAERIYRTLAAP